MRRSRRRAGRRAHEPMGRAELVVAWIGLPCLSGAGQSFPASLHFPWGAGGNLGRSVARLPHPSLPGGCDPAPTHLPRVHAGPLPDVSRNRSCHEECRSPKVDGIIRDGTSGLQPARQPPTGEFGELLSHVRGRFVLGIALDPVAGGCCDADTIRDAMRDQSIPSVIPMRRSAKAACRHRPASLNPETPRRKMLQQAEARPSRCHASRQDCRKRPRQHRHHVTPVLASPFVNMTWLSMPPRARALFAVENGLSRHDVR